MGRRIALKALPLGSVAALVLLVPVAGASGQRLAISPQPGTPDASPQTQISILGAKRGEIRSVQLTGTSSGPHTGRLLSYSRHRGASFVPDRPFTEGESVAAVIRVKRRKPISFSFTVARFGRIPPPLNLTSTQPDKLEHFQTDPRLTPPKLTINRTSRKARGHGSLLLTPLPSPVVHPETNNTVTIKPVGPGGPMISDAAGNLIWFRQLDPPQVATNLRLQRFKDRPVLTWWEGTVTPTAFGVGGAIIADSSYRILKVVKAGNGYPMDLHDFTITPEGDALFTIYQPILVHLPGTPAGTLSPLLDSIVQQVDIATGLVTWEWHGYGNIPLEQSQANPQNSASFDAYRFNAVQPLKHDRVLISARDTSAIYNVDRASGRILWTLGGKASDFKLGPGAQFYFQHDVQSLGKGLISMFDDGAGPPMLNPFSRGLVLRLNARKRTANVVRSLPRNTTTSAQSEGSVQRLPGGNWFVGFGSEPYFSEFTPGGRLILDGSLPADDGTYRTYRERWTGRPQTPPAIVARRTSASTASVFASWNGSTQVARWRVLAGDSAGSLKPVATVRKLSFETRIDLQTTASAFVVRALDSKGRVIGRSVAVGAS